MKAEKRSERMCVSLKSQNFTDKSNVAQGWGMVKKFRRSCGVRGCSKEVKEVNEVKGVKDKREKG